MFHAIYRMFCNRLQAPLRDSAADHIEEVTGGKVFSGPFKGMKYVESSIASAHLPKLLGTYELELHPYIEKICKKNIQNIVNVGAGEGYYAVGLAIRNPDAEINAFETSIQGRSLIRKMAEMNGVNSRMTINGLCDAKALSDSIPEIGRSLIFMDIEGGEAVLLDNYIIPKLNRCSIVVELHDLNINGIGEIISARFKSSHKISEIWQRERFFEDLQIPISGMYSLIPKRYFVEAMNEYRFARMRWFHLEPKDFCQS